MKYSLQLVRSFVTSPNERWVNHTFIVGHHNNSVKFIIIRVDPTLWPLGLLLLLLFLTLFLIFYQHYCIFHVCTMAINIIRKTWTELRMLSHPNHLPPRLFLADDKRGKIAQEKPPSHKYVTIHRKPNLKWCSWCRKSDTRNSAVWCSRCSLAHLAPRSPPRVWHYTRRCCCCCSPAALALPDLQPRDEENCGAKCVFRAEIGARILIPPALPPPAPSPIPPICEGISRNHWPRMWMPGLRIMVPTWRAQNFRQADTPTFFCSSFVVVLWIFHSLKSYPV